MNGSGKVTCSHLRILTTRCKQSFDGLSNALHQCCGSSVTFISDLINPSSFLSLKFKSNQGVCKWAVVHHMSPHFFPMVDSSSKAKLFQIWNLFFPLHTRKSAYFYSLLENTNQIQIGPSAATLSLQMASALRGWYIPPQRTHSTCHNFNKVEVSQSVSLSNLSVYPSFYPLLKHVLFT